jgi:hypothetical protein
MYNDEKHLPLNQRTMPTFEEFLLDEELLAMYPEVLVNSAWLEDEESRKQAEDMTLYECYISTVDFVWGPEASAKLKEDRRLKPMKSVRSMIDDIEHVLQNINNDVYEDVDYEDFPEVRHRLIKLLNMFEDTAEDHMNTL